MEVQNINKIKQIVNYIDTQQQNEEFKKWIKTISLPSFQLINNLIKLFLLFHQNKTFCNSILRVLRKLNQYVPQIITPQMKKNKNFPKAITHYISNTHYNEIQGDGLILLVNLFNENTFKIYSDNVFIQKIIDLIEHIKDEKVFRSVVQILVRLNSVDSEKKLLNILLTNKNQRYFSQILMQIFNKEHNQKMMVQLIRFIKEIYQRTNEFFYKHDFKILIDIIIRSLQNRFLVIGVVVSDKKRKLQIG